jgi:hypothetical protein
MYEFDVTDILDPATDEVVNHCLGPTAQGSCPGAGPDGVVLCSGCRVAAPDGGPECWNLFVPAASQHCPRAWNLDAVGY